MQYNTIFFVTIVQLFYVCKVWGKHDYGDGYKNTTNRDDSHPGISYSVTKNSGPQYPGLQYPSPRYPRSPQCPRLPQPKFAAMSCRASNSRRTYRTCSAQCIAHHVFKGTKQNRMVLQCRQNNWTPRYKFPNCVSDGKCGLKLVDTVQGKITCKSDKTVIRCTITCNGKNYGWFICLPSGKWSSPLPKCAKDKSG